MPLRSVNPRGMSAAESPAPSFFARLALAFVLFWRLLFNPELARQILPLHRGQGLPAPEALPALPREPFLPPKPAEVPPEVKHASGLLVLGMLQREGRLIDFLQEEVAPFSDAEVGAAARVVHEGCRKVLGQLVSLAPVLTESEGTTVTVAQGFDPQRIRLTGNVAGQPPFRGALKHPGWAATAVHFPTLSEAMDARVLAPAEVELS